MPTACRPAYGPDMVVVAHRFSGMLIAVLTVAFIAACSTGHQTSTSSTDQVAQSPAGGGGGGSLVAAVRKVTDVCALMPTDLVATIVPGASAPESQKFPPYKCRVSNGTAALEVTFAGYDPPDPPVPNEPVTGLGLTAFMQKQTVDDAYLKVVLDAGGGAIYVEVAGHDGKDHGDDAIAIAKRLLAKLT
jgi:hypothetical protein